MSLTSRLGFDAASSPDRPPLVIAKRTGGGYEAGNGSGRQRNRQHRSRGSRNKIRHQQNQSSVSDGGGERSVDGWWKQLKAAVQHKGVEYMYFWASRGQKGTCQVHFSFHCHHFVSTCHALVIAWTNGSGPHSKWCRLNTKILWFRASPAAILPTPLLPHRRLPPKTPVLPAPTLFLIPLLTRSSSLLLSLLAAASHAGLALLLLPRPLPLASAQSRLVSPPSLRLEHPISALNAAAAEEARFS
jgi:hypothetical protein